MCGIAGQFSVRAEPADKAALAAMIGALSHRGPDGSSTFAEGPVGLAHARLSIIDLA
ncbi:partial Asparagine synthetase [glutamine-hydrolyzing] 2, partial [Burkholderiaceae bacterium]